MRRSEMVDWIAHLVYMKSHMDVVISSEEANEILRSLEELGMKPPCVDADKCQALMQVYMDPSFNVWDEDFEKDETATEVYKQRMEYKDRRKQVKEKLNKK